jgi:hypothetical protein
LSQGVVLRRRAELHAARQEHALALADLSTALCVNPSDVDALLLRAEVHRATGSHERCFLDLRTVSLLAPAVCVLLPWVRASTMPC